MVFEQNLQYVSQMYEAFPVKVYYVRQDFTGGKRGWLNGGTIYKFKYY